MSRGYTVKSNLYSSGQHNLYRKNAHKQPFSPFLFVMRNPIKPKYNEAAIGKAIKSATKIGICRVKSQEKLEFSLPVLLSFLSCDCSVDEFPAFQGSPSLSLRTD